METDQSFYSFSCSALTLPQQGVNASTLAQMLHQSVNFLLHSPANCEHNFKPGLLHLRQKLTRGTSACSVRLLLHLNKIHPSSKHLFTFSLFVCHGLYSFHFVTLTPSWFCRSLLPVKVEFFFPTVSKCMILKDQKWQNFTEANILGKMLFILTQ